ncbi:winged helix-turn-helix domain-containing protein [Brevibacillus massiliensis]|uniref:winged helix-turn-helix domain-containing protein n=1 Tax=Brevibacillus massiliensis TaxID=1118054 RepID=UPI0036F3092B
MAKIRSHLRRTYGEYASRNEERVIEQAGLTLYPERMEAGLHGKAVSLTKKESDLLEMLMSRYPRVVSRESLLEKLWDDQSYVDDNTLNVNITRVRKKLQELGIEDGIETVRGSGYRLTVSWGGRQVKLFVRESLPLFFVNLAQLFIISLTFWLSGAGNTKIALYAMFLGIFLLVCYLIYRYLSNRYFYQRLSTPPESLEEFSEPVGWGPLNQALHQLLHGRLYQAKIHEYDRKKREHVTFISQWVHQMKTPLSVISLTVQEEDDPRAQSIREEADRLAKGLEMVLYATRMDVFEQDFRVERVVLRELVHKVIQENKRLFIRNYVYPDLQVEPGLTVESDAKWLFFVVGQLITNAIRYSSGSQQNVTVSSTIRGCDVVLEVRDRGVGIPSGDIKRIFRPFFTGENGRVFQESTGMGLYLVKEICTRLNHQVEVESEVGVGTAMRIVFPHAVKQR